MAKARTLSPFYTKRMQRMAVAATRTNDLQLILTVTAEIKRAIRFRAFHHLIRHSWPAQRTGVNYGAIDTNLGLMARFS
jgi:hypothetical protein